MKSIPGERGWPVLGHAISFVNNSNALHSKMVKRHGPVYYNYYLNTKVIGLMSPAANEFVLLDRDKNFSSRKAWNIALAELFPNGLMLRDGDEHRYHRRLLSAPFKADALAEYVAKMNPQIESTINDWAADEQVLFYPLAKQLTLDLAAQIFLGATLNKQAATINQAVVDVVDASVAIIKHPSLSTRFRKGLKGRKGLEDYFNDRIDQKRVSNDADMFAQVCRVEDDQGQRFSRQDIVDHMIFLMMAAHDTTTSSLSSIAYALAKNPQWQAKLFDEIQQIGTAQLSYKQMDEFGSADLVLKEALRMYPPLATIPRSVTKDCEFNGYRLNRGDMVHVSPYFTHHLSKIWTAPYKFDPLRFSPERAEDRTHKHAYIPFGGGAHKCLGLKFAELQVKLVLFYLLKTYELKLPKRYQMPFAPAPIGKPKDNLPIRLVTRR